MEVRVALQYPNGRTHETTLEREKQVEPGDEFEMYAPLARARTGWWSRRRTTASRRKQRRAHSLPTDDLTHGPPDTDAPAPLADDVATRRGPGYRLMPRRTRRPVPNTATRQAANPATDNREPVVV